MKPRPAQRKRKVWEGRSLEEVHRLGYEMQEQQAAERIVERMAHEQRTYPDVWGVESLAAHRGHRVDEEGNIHIKVDVGRGAREVEVPREFVEAAHRREREAWQQEERAKQAQRKQGRGRGISR